MCTSFFTQQMCTTAAAAGAGCWWTRCFPVSIFQLLQPGDGEIHKQPICWILIEPLMLGPGPVSMAVLSQHCAECSPEEHDDIIPIFSQKFSLHFSSFQTSFPQGNSPGHPTLSFCLQVSVDTSFTATFEGFLAPTATPFLPSISPSFSGICHLWLSGSFSNPSFSPCLPRRCTFVPAAYCLQLLSPLGTHLRPKYSPALSPFSMSRGATQRALIFQHISYELAFNYY